MKCWCVYFNTEDIVFLSLCRMEGQARALDLELVTFLQEQSALQDIEMVRVWLFPSIIDSVIFIFCFFILKNEFLISSLEP